MYLEKVCQELESQGPDDQGVSLSSTGAEDSPRSRCSAQVSWPGGLSTDPGVAVGTLGSASRCALLKGSWDLVTRVLSKVTILIITYNL